MGPGSTDLLTGEAVTAIGQAELIIGSKRLIQNYQDKKRQEAVTAQDIVENISKSDKENIAVLMSGDTGFYSGASKLRKLLEKHSEELSVKVFPGISSVVYFSARIGIDWENASLLSLHGKKQTFIPVIKRSRYTFLLTQGNVGEICDRLTKTGLGKCKVWVGENLSYEKEHIFCDMAQNLSGCVTEKLVVLAVENPHWKNVYSVGIPDENFVRGKVPMTKREIRAAVVSRMALHREAVVCDIGAGTGSVSVELALQALSGKVYAVEKNEEACHLIQENAENFGLDNIEVVCGMAVSVLEALPVCDAAFIGGSGGQLAEIFEILMRKNPQIHIVITAITLETLNEAIALLEKYGFKADVVQISVNNLNQRGRYHMFEAQNPVYVIDGLRRCEHE
jgi:precorrin-6Y C5,15-methyltransferase (decarboxylating)